MSNVTDRNVIDIITMEDRNLVMIILDTLPWTFQTRAAQKCPDHQSKRLSRVRLRRAGLLHTHMTQRVFLLTVTVSSTVQTEQAVYFEGDVCSRVVITTTEIADWAPVGQ